MTSTIRTFINGQQTGSLVNTYSLTSGSQNQFIGGINGQTPSSLNAYVDEVRISKGIARWTANFTPPNHEYGPVVTPVASNIRKIHQNEKEKFPVPFRTRSPPSRPRPGPASGRTA